MICASGAAALTALAAALITVAKFCQLFVQLQTSAPLEHDCPSHGWNRPQLISFPICTLDGAVFWATSALTAVKVKLTAVGFVHICKCIFGLHLDVNGVFTLRLSLFLQLLFRLSVGLTRKSLPLPITGGAAIEHEYSPPG